MYPNFIFLSFISFSILLFLRSLVLESHLTQLLSKISFKKSIWFIQKNPFCANSWNCSTPSLTNLFIFIKSFLVYLYPWRTISNIKISIKMSQNEEMLQNDVGPVKSLKPILLSQFIPSLSKKVNEPSTNLPASWTSSNVVWWY